MMPLRVINVALLITSSFCFLEWGKDNSSFLFQVEYEIFRNGFNPDSIMHPLVFLPMVGQLLLIFSIIKPTKRITFIGMSMIGILVLLILVVGVISLHIKIILSTIPFLTIVVLVSLFSKRLA
jgi:hypothetical protein